MIDVGRRRIVDRIPFEGILADRLAVSPDGSELYLASEWGAGVVVNDLVRREAVARIQIERGWVGWVAVSPDGNRVVAASRARPATYFVDVEGFADN